MNKKDYFKYIADLDLKKYNLLIESNSENEIASWRLYRVFNDFDRELLLNSEDNTEKELAKFIKKRKKYELCQIFNITNTIIIIAGMLISFIGMTMDNMLIKFFGFGMEWSMFFATIIESYCSIHNSNISSAEIKEEIERFEKISGIKK